MAVWCTNSSAPLRHAFTVRMKHERMAIRHWLNHEIKPAIMILTWGVCNSRNFHSSLLDIFFRWER